MTIAETISLDCKYLIGLDEVGWGAIAGPVVVGCCVVERDWRDAKVKDSKKYASEKSREAAYRHVKAVTLHQATAFGSPEELATRGPGVVLAELYTTLAKQAVELYPDSVVVIDGSNKVKDLDNKHPRVDDKYVLGFDEEGKRVEARWGHPQLAIPKADVTMPCASAASVVAKVVRDQYMTMQHAAFPEFKWDKNKGYATPEHLEAMQKFGVSSHHRKNIKMVLDTEIKYGTSCRTPKKESLVKQKPVVDIKFGENVFNVVNPGPVTYDQVVSTLGLNPKQVQKALADLCKYGHVAKMNRGYVRTNDEKTST